MGRLIEVERAIGYEFEAGPSQWSARDLALFALATGAADDPSEDRQLRRAYELHPDGMQPLPAFFGVLAVNALVASLKAGHRAPGLHYGIERVLHAEQRIAVLAPLPTPNPSLGMGGMASPLTHRAKIARIVDKGRHALVVTEVETRSEGVSFLRSEVTSLVRSAGGFSGGAPATEPATGNDVSIAAPASTDARVEQATHLHQALLFRLLGDDNPLHADPRAVRAFGLKKPILHGMCTFSFALRHVIDSALGGGGEPADLVEASVRFSDVVFPGETLITEIEAIAADPSGSNEATRTVRFQTKVKERDRVVLSGGEARFRRRTAP